LNKVWTIIDILNWGEVYLKSKGIEEPKINLELFLCHILNLNRLQLYLNFDKPLNEEELIILKSFIKRRLNLEPPQYIIGYTYFLNKKIFVDKNVLIPRPETELIIDLVKNKYNENEDLRILDIGTGSGCISIAIADIFKKSKIDAIDYKDEILKIAKKNAVKNKIENIEFIKLNILNELPNKQYDLIISNPPYLSKYEYEVTQPIVKLFEPKSSLYGGIEGLDFYYRFSEIFKIILKQNGIFILEYGYEQKEKINKIFKNYKNIEFIKDFNGIYRFIIGMNN